MNVLIVEDEEVLASGLKFNFEQEGYDVALAGDGSSALDHIREDETSVDLVVLDLMLPGMSGYETCREIRKFNNDIPILVLSARTLSEDKTQAFDCGADQYMTKPFALPELLARVRNLLERRGKFSEQTTAKNQRTNGTYDFGDVHVDFGKFELTVRGQTTSLTTRELDLLACFIDNEGIVLSRPEILDQVWGTGAYVSTRTIDNFVMRLRKLIEKDPSDPRHILSVRGTGYRFVAQTDTATPGNSTT